MKRSATTSTTALEAFAAYAHGHCSLPNSPWRRVRCHSASALVRSQQHSRIPGSLVPPAPLARLRGPQNGVPPSLPLAPAFLTPQISNRGSLCRAAASTLWKNGIAISKILISLLLKSTRISRRLPLIEPDARAVRFFGGAIWVHDHGIPLAESDMVEVGESGECRGKCLLECHSLANNKDSLASRRRQWPLLKLVPPPSELWNGLLPSLRYIAVNGKLRASLRACRCCIFFFHPAAKVCFLKQHNFSIHFENGDTRYKISDWKERRCHQDYAERKRARQMLISINRRNPTFCRFFPTCSDEFSNVAFETFRS